MGWRLSSTPHNTAESPACHRSQGRPATACHPLESHQVTTVHHPWPQQRSLRSDICHLHLQLPHKPQSLYLLTASHLPQCKEDSGVRLRRTARAWLQRPVSALRPVSFSALPSCQSLREGEGRGRMESLPSLQSGASMQDELQERPLAWTGDKGNPPRAQIQL